MSSRSKASSDALIPQPLPDARPKQVWTFVIRTLGAILGWGIFFLWWRQVLKPEITPPQIIRLVVIELILLAMGIATAAAWWVLHNLRIAKDDRRWKLSRYVSPQFKNDYMGRQLILPNSNSLRVASIISIEVNGTQKAYVAKGERATQA